MLGRSSPARHGRAVNGGCCAHAAAAWCKLCKYFHFVTFCVDLMQAPSGQICLGQGGLSDRQSVGHWMH